jgi:DNA-binding Lrp family transcriptional regulator
MSVKHIGLVLDRLQAPPPLKLVALILADHADNEGVCWPSYRRIAERACMSERSARRHIKELQDQRIITKLRTGTIVKRDGKTIRISNAYRINTGVLGKARPVGEKISNELSTIELGINDTADHLEVATAGQHRWTRLSTKPPVKHNSNHNHRGNVENSKTERTLGQALDELLGVEGD